MTIRDKIEAGIASRALRSVSFPECGRQCAAVDDYFHTKVLPVADRLGFMEKKGYVLQGDELEKIAGIRPATQEDFERYKIKDIDPETSMHGTPHKVMIAEEGGKFQGLAAGTDDGRVSGLYVVPRYRKQGLATKLLGSLPTRPTRTRQRVGHIPSRAFYEKEGFKGTGTFDRDPKWGKLEHMERDLQGHTKFHEYLGVGECEAVCPEKFPRVIASEGKAEFSVSGEIENYDRCFSSIG
jgi:GNAT superfamily N-acetyltransferase